MTTTRITYDDRPPTTVRSQTLKAKPGGRKSSGKGFWDVLN